MLILEDNEPLTLDLTEGGLAVDLTGATVEVYTAAILTTGVLGTPYHAAATVVAPATRGRVSRPRGVGDFNTAGKFAAWVIVTFNSGSVRTYPSATPPGAAGPWLEVTVAHRPGS